VIILAPVALSATLAGMRLLAKSLVKVASLAYDKAREIAAEVGEQRCGLIAEVRAKMPSPAVRSSGPCFVHNDSPLASPWDIATGVALVIAT
jgi:hypothetical protein